MNEEEKEREALKKLMSDIFKDDHREEPMLTLETLQKIVFFCMENYDDWRQMKLVYEFDSNEETVVHVDIEEFFADGDVGIVIFSNTDGKEKLDLEKIDFLLHVMQEVDPEGWMSLGICCKLSSKKEEDDEFPFPNVYETYVDEEDNVLVLKI
jgi:hypothetical protein